MRTEIMLSTVIEEISMGPFGSDITTDNYVTSGVPVLNGSNIDNYKLTENSFNYVTEEKSKTFRKAVARRGDIVVTHRGTLGQIAYIPEKSKFERYVISQSQFRVRFNEKSIDPRYIVYLFHTPYGQKKLLSFKNHVGVPALAQATTNFRELELYVHEVNEQKRIADVITTIEEKIELNNKINAELEAMAKLIYDYWFVQFDFPNQQGKPYKSSGGKMVWNEELKREIPGEWNINNLEKVVKIRNGFAFKSEDYQETGIPIVRTKNFNDGSIILDDVVYLSNSKAKEFKEFHLNKFDFLLVMVGASVGKSVITPSNILPALQNQNMWNFLPINNTQKIFYNFLISKIVDEQLKSASGSAREFFRKDHFYSVKVAIPNDTIIKSFQNIVSPFFEKIDINLSEIEKLKSLRDWLLPMLMNGQVSVGKAEEAVAIVAEEKASYTKA